MEIYILDSALRRVQVVDIFESMIWTERFREVGEFELVIHSDPSTRTYFPQGARIAINNSDRVMVVLSTQNKKAASGEMMLTITGRSLEYILNDRAAVNNFSAMGTEPKWTLTGTPGERARQIFQDICVTGTVDVKDKIPFIQPGSIYPPDTIAETADVETVGLEPTTVLDAIEDICQVYGLGYRLVRNFDLSQLYFDVYSGIDRTTAQNNSAPVVFSSNLDNLEGITEFESESDYKNVAYVYSKNGSRMVNAIGIPAGIKGFDRRVLLVPVTDVDLPAGEALQAALDLKGREALAKHRGLSGFDGEVSQFGSYRYNVDYALGDLVEMQVASGSANNMRVTEQIFVSDSEGERSYPTLTIERFILSGTWLSWDYDQEWPDAAGPWADA